MKTIKRALICAPLLPEFDRESGSRRIYHLVEFFREAGWAVTFMAENPGGDERYVRILQQRGVAVYRGFDSHTANAFRLGRFDVAIFAFWYLAEAQMEALRRASPTTTIVVDVIDLHWLRNVRRGFLGDSAGSWKALDSDFAFEMVRELNTYAAADAVLTVSEKEAELLNDLLADRGSAHTLPDCEEVASSAPSFEDRRGIVFIGNFRHPPNLDAAKFLCEEIVPCLKPAVLEEHPLYIVGNEPPEEVLRYGHDSSSIHVVGWVPSLLPYLQNARVSVAPVRYGAGTKRKLLQAIAAGTPAVSTTIGIEGLNLTAGRHILVADDAATFARSVERVIEDKKTWSRLAANGRDRVDQLHGREAVKTRLLQLLSTIVGKQTAGPSAPVETDQRRKQTERIRQIVARVVPSGACVMVASRGDPELVQFNGRKGWHFPQTEDGRYAGHHPASDAEAIARLESLRAKGAQFLIFPATGRWWLDYYANLATHLSRHYKRVWSDDSCIIFELSGNGSVDEGKHQLPRGSSRPRRLGAQRAKRASAST